MKQRPAPLQRARLVGAVEARALGVEIKGVGETGATARFDPNPNRHLVREALGAHGPVNFLGCVFREADHVDLSGVR